MLSFPQVSSGARAVLILGASTRAAAQSAFRAGLAPLCGDQFADADLRAIAPVLEIADHPRGMVGAAAQAPDCPWMYTGGLENHPWLVGQIAASRPLWGNGPEVLERVRNPWEVARVLEEAGLPACRLIPREQLPSADGRWLLKRLRGAGGRGIRVWSSRESARTKINRDVYFQEYRSGGSYSALFLASGEVQQVEASPAGVPPLGGRAAPGVPGVERRPPAKAGTPTLLLGFTRQLVGIDSIHAPPFGWCGNIAPAQLPAHAAAEIRHIGECLGRKFGLRGLFGCDFIIDDQHAWLTEVNPRYPASTELLEWAFGIPFLDWHRRACEGAQSLGGLAWAECSARVAKPQACGVAGKIVLYANRSIIAPDFGRFIGPTGFAPCLDSSCRTLPYLADIPAPGTRISACHPIATLYALGGSEADCLEILLRRARRFQNSLT